ncbi:hypothetical protein C8A03DRAFT_12407 [Achaetomium macrosporum]|uniref:Uncharacterized protein n=1 Tax=Achaetomium macrosporum TaxID=79813 RepID=A0AAN7CHC2_9PEZI|nr:hypothetical protein C8A03DRAFT_12407 [Achaetomium macrosporum]
MALPPVRGNALKHLCYGSFPGNSADIVWERRLGGVVDGYVWKVKWADNGPFAMKVFWESESPPRLQYWAFQRECQNAAILQMITAAVEQTTESSPIRILSRPSTRGDALTNLYCFCDDGRRNPPVEAGPATLAVSSVPRFRKCYRWLKISGRDLKELDRGTLAPPILTIAEVQREILPDQEYFAIVYEYIPENGNDLAAVQSQIDFLCRTGFNFAPTPLRDNWKDSVLVDLSEIECPWQLGWSSASYSRGPRPGERELRDTGRYTCKMPVTSQCPRQGRKAVVRFGKDDRKVMLRKNGKGEPGATGACPTNAPAPADAAGELQEEG